MPEDRYVSKGGDDTNDGKSRPTAFATIQEGVEDLRNIGDTVHVLLDAPPQPTIYRQQVRMVGPTYNGITVLGETAPPPDPGFPHFVGCDAKPIIRGGWGNRGSLFRIRSVARVTLQNLTIEGGLARDGAGVLCRNSREFKIVECCIRRNNASRHGGGIALLTVNDGKVLSCQVESNNAYFGGGGYIEGCTGIDIDSTLFSHNQVTGDQTGGGNGGGLYIWGSRSVRIARRNEFLNNVAIGRAIGPLRFFYGSGGAIYVGNCATNALAVVISRNRFQDNVGSWGGAIAAQKQGYISVYLNRFVDNASRDDGGAIFVGQAGPDFIRTPVNPITDDGARRNVVVRRNLFFDNSAGDDGGAISATAGSAVRIESNRIWVNRATRDGGAISATWNSYVGLSGNSIVCNRAGRTGGGLSARNTHVTCSSGSFTFNRSGRSGGAAHIYTSHEGNRLFDAWLRLSGFGTAAASFSSTILNMNVAGGDGGGLSFEADPRFIPIFATVAANRFSSNLSSGAGGLGRNLSLIRTNHSPPQALERTNSGLRAARILVR